MKLYLILIIFIILNSFLSTLAETSWSYFKVQGINDLCGTNGVNLDYNSVCKRACGGNVLILKQDPIVVDGYTLNIYADSDVNCVSTATSSTKFVCKTANEPVVVNSNYNVTCFVAGTQPPGTASTISYGFGIMISIIFSILLLFH